MVAAFGGENSHGLAFILAAGVVYEIIAFTCSSPQTAELNIKQREGTLMKWVHLGQGLAIVLIFAAASIDQRHRNSIIAGGIFGMVSAEAFYLYARHSGLNNPGPGTERY